MFEVIAIIAVILAIAIAIVLILALTKPDTFRVQRATRFAASAWDNDPICGTVTIDATCETTSKVSAAETAAPYRPRPGRARCTCGTWVAPRKRDRARGTSS